MLLVSGGGALATELDAAQGPRVGPFQVRSDLRQRDGEAAVSQRTQIDEERPDFGLSARLPGDALQLGDEPSLVALKQRCLSHPAPLDRPDR